MAWWSITGTSVSPPTSRQTSQNRYDNVYWRYRGSRTIRRPGGCGRKNRGSNTGRRRFFPYATRAPRADAWWTSESAYSGTALA